MKRRTPIVRQSGFSLVELLVAVAILGICLAVASAIGAGGLRTQEARGAAQVWQSASAWAQLAVLWHGAGAQAECGRREISVVHSAALSGGLGLSTPDADIETNVPRWRQGTGARISFSGSDACPDSGGSLYFRIGGGGYRVVIRPESGLTARSRVGAVP